MDTKGAKYCRAHIARGKTMKTFVVFWGILFCLLLAGNSFSQPDRSSEVQSLLTGLESASSVKRVNAAKIISRSGLTDQNLYEKVASLLKEGYNAGTEANHVDEMAWLCKALAASGNDEYRPLLEEVAANAPSEKLKSYAQQSNGLIEEFAERSRILNQSDTWDESLSAEENRLINMLTSDNVSLKRDAAKLIVRRLNTSFKVFDTVAATLVEMGKNFQSDNTYVDTMAWLCKALAASGDRKYIATLEQVVATNDNSKLKTYASKALNSF